MSILLATCIGLIMAAGFYQLLGSNPFRISFGLYILLYGVNLLVLSMAPHPERNPPLAEMPGPHADPLVRAMVLTALIIGFGVGSFILLLTARLVKSRKTLSTEEINEWKQ